MTEWGVAETEFFSTTITILLSSQYGVYNARMYIELSYILVYILRIVGLVSEWLESLA